MLARVRSIGSRAEDARVRERGEDSQGEQGRDEEVQGRQLKTHRTCRLDCRRLLHSPRCTVVLSVRHLRYSLRFARDRPPTRLVRWVTEFRRKRKLFICTLRLLNPELYQDLMQALCLADR